MRKSRVMVIIQLCILAFALVLGTTLILGAEDVVARTFSGSATFTTDGASVAFLSSLSSAAEQVGARVTSYNIHKDVDTTTVRYRVVVSHRDDDFVYGARQVDNHPEISVFVAVGLVMMAAFAIVGVYTILGIGDRSKSDEAAPGSAKGGSK
jgi:hypothetical protein